MGQVAIHEMVPDTYNPTNQVVSWGDIMPPFSLPSDKIFILGKGDEWNLNQLFARGMTHVSHNDMRGVSDQEKQNYQNAGKTYFSVPITPELMGFGANGPDQWVGSYPDTYNRRYWPNGLPDYNGGRTLADGCDISHAITIAETLENLHYTNPAAPMWGGFWDRRAERLNARFGPGNWKQCHDYLFMRIGPDWGYVDEATARAYFRNLNSLPGIEHKTGNLKSVNMYTAGVYLGGPDRDNRAVYGIAMAARMYHAIDLYCVPFFDWEHEWMPNNKNGYRVNGGILYRENKFPVKDSVVAGCVVAGLHFGDGFIPWGAAAKNTNKIFSGHWMQELANGSFWVKDGETQQRHWSTSPNVQPGEFYNIVGWSSGVDMASFAAYTYAATLGQVYGGTVKVPRYRINGGDWINPYNQYQDDLCRAKANGMPIIETVLKDGREGLLWIAPKDNNKRKLVELEGQTGVRHSFEACGATPHLSLINL